MGEASENRTIYPLARVDGHIFSNEGEKYVYLSLGSYY